MTRAAVSYTIPPQISLKEVADAASTTPLKLRELNTNLTGKTDTTIAGLKIQVQQHEYGDGRIGDNKQVASNTLTEQQLKQRLAVLDERSKIRENRQNHNEQHYNEPNTVVKESECAEGIYDLVHVSEGQEDGTKTHKIILLTRAESEAFAEEEKLIQGAIDTFNQGLDAISEQADGETVRAEKQRLFDELVTVVPDIFTEGKSDIDPETGEKKPAGEEDPTPVIEIRRLGAIESGDTVAATEIALDDPDISDTLNSQMSMGKSTAVFNYVKGQTLKDVVKNGYKVYNIPPAGKAPWFDQGSRKINTQRLKDELKKIKNTEFDKSLEIKIGKSVTFFNTSAREWQNKSTWDLGFIGTEINVDREAQVFRFVSNASAEAGYDVLKKTATVSAKANAEFDLVRGKATLSGEFPCGENAHAKVEFPDGQVLDFGYFHLKVDLTVMGFAGASAMVCADIQADFSEGIPKIKSTSPYKEAARVGAEAFAGVRAGCEVKGAFEWIDTLEPSGQKTPWKTLAEAVVEAQLALGVGASAKFYLQFNNGTFSILLHAGLVWGPGATGKIGGTVHLDNIYVMAHFVYNALMKVDFHYLNFIQEEAFAKLKELSLGLLIQGISWSIEVTQALLDSSSRYISDVIDDLNMFFNGWSETKAALLAKCVLNDLNSAYTPTQRSIILHLSPEGKGQTLYRLIYINAPEFWFETPNQEPLQAVIALVETIQSSREMRLVFACMNKHGKVEETTSNKNFDTLMDYLRKYPAYQRRLQDHFDTLNAKAVNAAISVFSAHLRTILNGNVQPKPDQPVASNHTVSKNMVATLATTSSYRYYV